MMLKILNVHRSHQNSHILLGVQSGITILGTIWHLLPRKISIHLPYDVAIPIPGILSKRHGNKPRFTRRLVIMAALFGEYREQD